MPELIPRRHGSALWAGCLIAAAACTTAPKPAAPPAAAAPPPLEASYDWHGLLLVPFGTRLVDMPFTLHEVLLFRDASRDTQADDGECYAIDQSAPRFVGRSPSAYTLCFKHDRLSRVQATVNLPQSEAPQIFSDACGLWKGNGGAVQTAVNQGACDGHDGAVGYVGRLEGQAEQGAAALTVTLDAAVQP